MAEAIVSRLIEEQIYPAARILVSDRSQQRLDYLSQTYQVGVTSHNQEVLEKTDVIILAIKPQVLQIVLSELAVDISLNPKPLIISILAGVSLARLEVGFPDYPVIRAMPNTPATVGAGITAIAPGKQVTREQLTQAELLLKAIGKVVEVPENLMDAVTGLSGSGPAYVALLIEALSDGGVAAGLPRAIASELALETVLGTAKLLAAQELHPALLKDRVTSPGGTTIAGLAELEKAAFRSALIEAVKAAAARSQALGQANS